MARPLQRISFDKVKDLREKFFSAWARTDDIFAIVADSDLLATPIVWRHPFIFYVGHLPAFSWNQICGALLKWKSFNRYFDDLFCRGMDPDVDTGECHWHPEVPAEWPSVAETLAYRDKVRGAVLESLEAVRSDSTHIMARDERVFQMVLEHEFMHQETLVYMLQQLPLDRKRRPKSFPRYSFQRAVDSRAIFIPAGRARLGGKFEDLPFGWDNEFEEMLAEVPSFTIDSLPVTNGEYWRFVDSGAYDEPRFGARKTGTGSNLKARTIRSVGFGGNGSGSTAPCSTCFRWSKWPVGPCTSAWPKRAPTQIGSARDFPRKQNSIVLRIAGQMDANRFIPGAIRHRQRSTATLTLFPGRRCRSVHALPARAAGE